VKFISHLMSHTITRDFLDKILCVSSVYKVILFNFFHSVFRFNYQITVSFADKTLWSVTNAN